MSKLSSSIVALSGMVFVAFPCAAAEEAKAVAVNKLIGRGVNMGGALDAPQEGDWGITLQEGYFQIIKDAGFNSIRLPVRWNAHAANNALVICAAGNSCIDHLHLLELPKDDRNLIVSIFYYTPAEFTLQGAIWIKGFDKWLGTKWAGSDAEKQRIAKDFDIAADWAKRNNRPIYLNEFGAYEKADMESRIRWTKCVTDTAIERGFSLSYWEFCSGFGLYDLQAKVWRKELLRAVIP